MLSGIHPDKAPKPLQSIVLETRYLSKLLKVLGISGAL
ncbi:hypothetical protein BURPS1710A_0402 [Burkholderia pseudomallei 1710a]|uniref:Uncharacterized protein n=1 Tax=Burkholderia pseudomallei 1710a TaxID=320371 RepID=A0A0E1W9A1_BURPE|nr:hypothetical protein BURPS1710A_0402 [Burkholderia pseudomallei 1710a]